MINFFHTSIGDNAPKIVNAVIEIPKDSNLKIEFDIVKGYFKLDRCLISSMRYPASYGFIPQTISDDNDPLDILVYNTVPVPTGIVVECRPIGALETCDNGQLDYKILGIPIYNPNNYKKLNDLDPLFLDVVKDFFKGYKKLNKKRNNVVVRDWIGVGATELLIRDKHEAYKELFKTPNP